MLTTLDTLQAAETGTGIGAQRTQVADYQVEVDCIDRAEWFKILPDFEDAMIYQTWSYGTVRWGRHNLSHIVLKRNGKIVAMAQARILKLPMLPGGIAYIGWGPLWRLRGGCKDFEVLRRMVRALKEEYAVRRGLFLRVLPYEFDGDEAAEKIRTVFKSEGFGWQPTFDRTLLLDVQHSREALRQNLSAQWRRNLNTAEKKGLALRVGTNDELYLAFRKLYTQILERKKFVPGVDVDEFRAIQQDLPEPFKMNILVCEHEGEPVTALLGALIGDTGIFVLGATGNNGMKLRGSYLLQWHMIEWFKQRGARWYDLGGINPEKNPGTYQFKSGLAGKAGMDVCRLGQFDACHSALSKLLVLAGERCQTILQQLKTPRQAEEKAADSE